MCNNSHTYVNRKWLEWMNKMKAATTTKRWNGLVKIKRCVVLENMRLYLNVCTELLNCFYKYKYFVVVVAHFQSSFCMCISFTISIVLVSTTVIHILKNQLMIDRHTEWNEKQQSDRIPDNASFENDTADENGKGKAYEDNKEWTNKQNLESLIWLLL